MYKKIDCRDEKRSIFYKFFTPPRLRTFSAYVPPLKKFKTQVCWLILRDETSSSYPSGRTYLLPMIMRNEKLHHLKVEDIAWSLKLTKPHSTPKWKISHFTTYCRSIVARITTRTEKSLIFFENFFFKVNSQNGQNCVNDID